MMSDSTWLPSLVGSKSAPLKYALALDEGWGTTSRRRFWRRIFRVCFGMGGWPRVARGGRWEASFPSLSGYQTADGGARREGYVGGWGGIGHRKRFPSARDFFHLRGAFRMEEEGSFCAYSTYKDGFPRSLLRLVMLLWEKRLNWISSQDSLPVGRPDPSRGEPSESHNAATTDNHIRTSICSTQLSRRRKRLRRPRGPPFIGKGGAASTSNAVIEARMLGARAHG